MNQPQFSMSDYMRHELARRGFFTCAMVIGDASLYWPTEDWTRGGRKLRIDSKAGLVLAGVATPFANDEQLLQVLDGLGYLPLEESPVPAYYFPLPVPAPSLN